VEEEEVNVVRVCCDRMEKEGAADTCDRTATRAGWTTRVSTVICQ